MYLKFNGAKQMILDAQIRKRLPKIWNLPAFWLLDQI